MTRAYNTATTQQNTGGAVAGVTAGKNAVINGAFDIWQRGTTFTNPGANTYGPDRWTIGDNTGCVYTRQSTDAPTGFQYFARAFRTAATTSTTNINFVQSIDTSTSIPFAGKTVTFSLYLRKGANGPSTINIALVGGTNTDGSLWAGGGNGGTIAGAAQTITTTWTRYTFTGTVPSNTTQLFVWAYYAATGTAPANEYFDITGVQLEAGSVATPFSRAAGTIQGELAACQRYYWRAGGDTAYQTLASGCIVEGSAVLMALANPVPMRTTPTSVDYSTLMVYDGVAINAVSTVSLNLASRYTSRVQGNPATAPTANRPYWLFTNNSTSGYIGFSAEL